MLKTRIVGVVVVRDGIAVQSIGFRKYLPVGSPAIAVEYLNQWGIDEIAVLEIDATANGSGPDIDKIREFAKFSHVPLAIGGGISTVDHMRAVLQAGADKVVLNTAIVQNPKILSEGAKLFGAQCIVASIDAGRRDDGIYEVLLNSGKKSTGLKPSELAARAVEMGAGEILLNSVDRDGMKIGFDSDLIQTVVRAVNVPIIVCGGAGHPQHFADVMKLDVSAVAAANFFHHSEHSVTTTKSFLAQSKSNIRLDSYVRYNQHKFWRDGRISKLDDDSLDRLRFEYIPEEKI